MHITTVRSILLITCICTGLSNSYAQTWIRNTYPGPGHKADPTYPAGQGQDRSEFSPGFFVSPIDDNFKVVLNNMRQGHYTVDGTAFKPMSLKPFRGGLSVAFNPHDADVAYQLVSEFWPDEHFVNDEVNGIYKTVNAGADWSLVKSVPVGHYMPSGFPWCKRNMIVDPAPARSTHVYYGSPTEGLVRSTDDGVT
jgi:hypothetical protein